MCLCRLLCLLLLLLSCPCLAETPREAFERALEEARYNDARGLAEWLPPGPPRQIALAEWAINARRLPYSYRLLDGIEAATLPPEWRPKYLLVRARQQSIDDLGLGQGNALRLLKDGLAASPSRHDEIALLMQRVSWLAFREDRQRASEDADRLMELSPEWGLRARATLEDARSHYKESLGIWRFLAEHAELKGQSQLRARFVLNQAGLLIRMGQEAESAELLQSLLREQLERKEYFYLAEILSFLGTRDLENTASWEALYRQTLDQLPPSFEKLELMSGLRRSELKEESRQEGQRLAHSLQDPIAELGFLLLRIEQAASAPEKARMEAQAHQLLSRLDRRGMAAATFGQMLILWIAKGLDQFHGEEMLAAYRQARAQATSFFELREIGMHMLGLSDRPDAWVWQSEVIGNLLEDSAEVSLIERTWFLSMVVNTLERQAFPLARRGEAETYAPNGQVMASSMGSRYFAPPESVRLAIEAFVHRLRAAPEAKKRNDTLHRLAQLLFWSGRTQESLDVMAGLRRQPEADVYSHAVRQLEWTNAQQTQDLAELLRVAQLGSEPSNKSDWRRSARVAWLCLAQQRFDDAERLARRSIEQAPAQLPFRELRAAGVSHALALALAGQGRVDEALATIAQAEEQDAAEPDPAAYSVMKAEVLADSGSPAQGAALLDTLPPSSVLPRQLYRAQLRHRIAVQLAETERAEALAEEMRGLVAAISAEVSDPFILHHLLSGPAYAALPISVSPPPLPVRAQPTLAEVLEQLELLRRREPDNQALQRLSATELRQAAERAARDDLFLRPVLLEHSLVLVGASRDRLWLDERFGDTQALRAALTRLIGVASSPNASLVNLESDRELVSRWLVQPWSGEFPQTKHLLWQADDGLKSLPLALLTRDSRSLLESTDTVYVEAPTAGLLPPLLDGTALLLGGSEDLEGAREELSALRAMFPQSVDWRLGDPPSHLRELASGCRLLHVAAHGLAPGRSRLAGELSGSQGSLSAFRLSELVMPAGSLAVVSACHGGQTYGDGRDNTSLLAALRTAGASYVVGSPWELDDLTSKELFLSFYRDLRKNPHPARALARAQLLTASSHPHPFHWAGPRVLSGP